MAAKRSDERTLQRAQQRAEFAFSDSPNPANNRPRRHFTPLGKLTAAAAVLIALVLVGIALLLPPFSILNRIIPNIPIPDGIAALDGLRIEGGGTFDARLLALTRAEFLGEPLPADTLLRQARTAFPPTFTLLSSVYRIAFTEFSSDTLTITLAVPPDAGDSATRDLYGYDAAAKAWRFIPAQQHDGVVVATRPSAEMPAALALVRLPPPIPTVAVMIEPGQSLTPQIAVAATVIYPAGLTPISSGGLGGALPAGVAVGAGYAVAPVLRNYDATGKIDPLIADRLTNPAFVLEHTRRIVELVQTNGFTGVVLDYRGLIQDRRDKFTAFVKGLSRELHAIGATLTIVIAPPTVDPSGQSDAYDWAALGAAADGVGWVLPLTPSLWGQRNTVDAAFRWVLEAVDRRKLSIVLSAQTVETSGSVRTIPYRQSSDLLGKISISPGTVVNPGSTITVGLTGGTPEFGVDASAGAPYLRLTTAEGVITRWITTDAAFRTRIARLFPYTLGGVLISDVGLGGTPTWIIAALNDYRWSAAGAKFLVPVPESPRLLWTVRDGTGKVVAMQESVPSFSMTVMGAPGTLTISAEFVGLGLGLEAVTVNVVLPAPPPPTATPPPSPTPDSTPLPPGG